MNLLIIRDPAKIHPTKYLIPDNKCRKSKQSLGSTSVRGDNTEQDSMQVIPLSSFSTLSKLPLRPKAP